MVCWFCTINFIETAIFLKTFWLRLCFFRLQGATRLKHFVCWFETSLPLFHKQRLFENRRTNSYMYFKPSHQICSTHLPRKSFYGFSATYFCKRNWFLGLCCAYWRLKAEKRGSFGGIFMDQLLSSSPMWWSMLHPRESCKKTLKQTLFTFSPFCKVLIRTIKPKIL